MFTNENVCKHNKTINEECLDYHWNAAIEAAASALDDIGQSKHTLESTIYHQQLANKTRKLKK